MAVDTILELMIAERNKLDAAIKLLQGGGGIPSLITTPTPKKAVKTAPKKGHGMSAEARARIASAQKARWAKVKKAGKKSSE